MKTREEWLTQFANRYLWPLIGGNVPAHRISVGFPSKSATARRRRRIGECWQSAQVHSQGQEARHADDKVRVSGMRICLPHDSQMDRRSRPAVLPEPCPNGSRVGKISLDYSSVSARIVIVSNSFTL